MNKAQQIARHIRALRNTSELVREVADSKIDALAASLARTMPDNYSFAQLENEVGSNVAQFPSLKVEYPDSAQAAKAAQAERAANPTRADFAAMSPAARLEAINRRNQRDREAEAAKAGKADGTGYTREQVATMPPLQRLRLANTWKRLGMKAEDLPQGPMSKEQLAKADATGKLYEANKVTHDATKTDKDKP